ncbi:MAG: Flp pilus assembly complex ATPase component TadA [Sulfuricurvum sp.]|jgi:general secretion pathway protein E|uniref:GspE/PulE family protein n=1 Tax=Sulfuricurvum sp. TaxID=2025608 RepID=UPI0025F3D08D|nr:type II/IV secretion system protein [Sulfuricurvum sp.]MCK9373889.1 Flp pilus assembly complex ATPase component TadA [Sulfuricurvum sp.]
MDRITHDLLEKGHITHQQIDRLTSRGVQDDTVLETLTKVGAVSINFIKRFIVEQIRLGRYQLSIIKNYHFLDEPSILAHLAEVIEVPFIDLDSLDMDYRLVEKIPTAQLKRYVALPVSQDDMYVVIAFADPLNIEAQESIQRLFPRKSVKIAVATEKQIQAYLFKIELKDSVKELVNNIRNELRNIGSVEEQQEASSILQLIDVILKACIKGRASDIHIEPTEKNCVVRGRIDGKLTEIFIFDRDIYPPLASRIKLLANLDIAERRKPQDGRFSAIVMEAEFDFRLSTLPIIYGESIVMRILDKAKALVKLEDSGMDSASYQKLIKGLHAPFGIILVTGPTGSGKTTTLYGALNELRNVEDKVITVEDPVEYRMNLIQQVQINPKVGLSFADALRSILRQDPDKIMIGEIRDHETLEIAIKAALTGHLVISTLHTNDAISAIPRMADMGIEPYLISGALVAVQAQRLVRRICKHCKREADIPLGILQEYSAFIPAHTVFYEGAGCKECNGNGYMGREMICEVLPITETLSSLIARGASKDELLTQAKGEGFVGMFENGMAKAVHGITTLDEILRVAKG